MKKSLGYILAAIYATACLITGGKFVRIILDMQEKINELQDKQKELQAEYAEAEGRYSEYTNANEKLRDDIIDAMSNSQELEKQLECWKKTQTDGDVFFDGHWTADILFKAAETEEKEYCKEITFQDDYIYMSGSYIVNEPDYNVVMRWKLIDIWDEMEKMGFTMEEMNDAFSIEYDTDKINPENGRLPEGLFTQDYYVEMTINETNSLNREIKEEEKDFIYDAKYYVLDKNTMLCATQNDGGKLYVLKRD